jgi:hypothetical protein
MPFNTKINDTGSIMTFIVTIIKCCTPQNDIKHNNKNATVNIMTFSITRKSNSAKWQSA